MPATADFDDASTAWDLSAFEGPADRRAAREFLDSGEPHAVELQAVLASRLRKLRLVAIVGVFAFFAGIALYRFLPSEGNDKLEFTLTFGGLLSIVMYVIELRRSSGRHAYRIARFAEANGFAFSTMKDSAGYAGMMFTNGTDHRRWMTVNGAVAGRSVEFGNLFYREAGPRAFLRRRGYIAIRLPARLPRMVIAKRESPYSPLTIPRYPHRDELVDVGQRRAFRLYTPEGAAFVARAMFTPEMIELFARLAKRYSMEIVGDMLFLTRFRVVSTGRARQWAGRLADVEALARALDVSDVWQVMRSQPKRFLRSLPEIRLHPMSSSPVFAAMVAVGVVLAITAVISALLFLPRMLS